MPCGRRHRREVDLAHDDSSDISCRQWRRQEFSDVERQTPLEVIRLPGQLDPPQIGVAIFLRQGQQERRALATGGHTQLARGEDLQRLVLPDHRLVSCGVVRRGGLDVSQFAHFLPPQRGGRLHVGDEFLAERLRAPGYGG